MWCESVCVGVHTALFPNFPINRVAVLSQEFESENHFMTRVSGKCQWCNTIWRDRWEPTQADNEPLLSDNLHMISYFPGDNSVLWSNAMLCSCLPGQRKKWKNRKKSEYSTLPAWRLGFSGQTMRTRDLIFFPVLLCKQTLTLVLSAALWRYYIMTAFASALELPSHTLKHTKHSTMIIFHENLTNKLVHEFSTQL